nr:hypothetical protein [Tanacetum cinerariifolium]
LDPQHEAALRAADPSALREITRHPVGHQVSAALILAAHPAHVRLVMPGLKKFGNRQLRLGRGGAGADVFHVQHTVEVAARCNPADPQAGRQGFRERAAKQD